MVGIKINIIPLGWLLSETKNKWKIFILKLIWNLKGLKGIHEFKTILRKWNKLEASFADFKMCYRAIESKHFVIDIKTYI